MKIAAISSVLAVVFSLSAQAGLYTYNYNDSGPIPQGGTTLPFEHAISGIPSYDYSISGIELVLTFSSGYHVGPGTTINGTLILDPSGSATYASFTPSLTSAGTGGQQIYDMTFANFNGFNPNNIWALNLWDTSTSGIENGLVGWTLDVTAVPEPVNVALAVFGGLLALLKLVSWRRRQAA
jgi:hypothetical protein